MAIGRWHEPREFLNGEGLKGPHPSLNTGQGRGDLECRIVQGAGLAVGALALTHLPAAANQGHQ